MRSNLRPGLSLSHQRRRLDYFVFTARCYAERGYATVSRPSVCLSVRLSVTLRYVFHTGWNTSKRISRPKA